MAVASDVRARVGAAVYPGGLCALSGVSGTYHRGPWSARARARMRRLDHATIFVMIAGTYTPLCLVALRHHGGGRLLALVWAGAVMGVAMAAAGVAERPVIGMVTYITLGWVAVLALPALSGRLSTAALALVVAGGIVYTLGGIVLGTRWPNPSPRVFGYHEVWHVMVVVACVCHYLVIVSVVGAT